MKRITLVLLAAVLLLAPAAAQTTLSGFSLKDARSLGMGGAFIAVSEGYQSLFGNPAGFASKKGELTILAPSVWVYVRPSAENIQLLQTAANGDEDASTEALDSLLLDNGFGVGAQVGIGWAGKGVGIGAFVTADAYAVGETLAGATMDVDAQANLVLGLARPVSLFGARFTVGGDLRPFYRVIGNMPLSEAVGVLLDGDDPSSVFLDQEAVSAFGLAVDLGASIELGAFKIGLAVRDIAPSFTGYTNTVEDLADSGVFVSSGYAEEELSLTPNVVVGVQYHPVFSKISWLLDPRFVLELQDPVSVIQGQESVFNLIHAGVEVKTLKFLSLRAGINEGWLSAGLGVDLFIVEINAAVFTEELGWRPGQNGRSGVVVEAAIRL